MLRLWAKNIDQNDHFSCSELQPEVGQVDGVAASRGTQEAQHLSAEKTRKDSLMIRAANDPSVFTITEKAPTNNASIC